MISITNDAPLRPMPPARVYPPAVSRPGQTPSPQWREHAELFGPFAGSRSQRAPVLRPAPAEQRTADWKVGSAGAVPTEYPGIPSEPSPYAERPLSPEEGPAGGEADELAEEPDGAEWLTLRDELPGASEDEEAQGVLQSAGASPRTRDHTEVEEVARRLESIAARLRQPPDLDEWADALDPDKLELLVASIVAGYLRKR